MMKKQLNLMKLLIKLMLYGCINNYDLVTENELSFKSDIELAKKYEALEAASALGIYNIDESNIDETVQ